MLFLRDLAASLLALSAASTSAVAAQALSVSHGGSADANSLRASLIQQKATQIQNEPRVLPVAGVQFPLYNGPAWVPGSLTTQIQMQELAKLRRFGMPTADTIAQLAGEWSKDFASMDDFVAFYDDIAAYMEKPMCTDNSDETFGAQRLVLKGFNMRVVDPGEYMGAYEDDGDELSVSDEQLQHVCGAGVKLSNIREKHALFVSEFDDVSQFNDPEQKHRKFVPDVVAFFCFNADKQQLLPLEIRLLETGLAYTPFDTEDEWTLAKMALEATEIDYQNMQHMAETHAMSIPIRVEAYRTMSEEHPVYQLFLNHVFADFALEMLSAKMLLNVSTEVDKTFGFGATGAIRFLGHQINEDTVYVNLENDFPTDTMRRGLHHIPTHKYATYGKLYYAAFDEFVRAFLDVYYSAPDALENDVELHNWAAACAKVPHLRGFPKKFESKDQLRKLLVHFIFQSTFKHHAMNGMTSWHGVAMPYCVPAVWKALPTKKLKEGERLNLLEYTIPKELAADQVRSPAGFFRAIPLSETLLDAYREARFADEPKLFGAIREYETALRKIDTQLAETEPAATQTWPLHLYRPTKLAYYTWI